MLPGPSFPTKPLFLHLCLLWLSACAGHQSSPASVALSLPGESIVPLDEGRKHWLSVGEHSGIQVFNGNAQAISRWQRTAEFLDSRLTSTEGKQRTLFASFDTGQNRVLLFSVSTPGFTLQQELISEPIAFPVEGLCLHKDQQDRLHLFLLSELYEAHQYLLQAQREGHWRLLPVRTLPTGPNTELCTTLDARETLITNENEEILWAYSTRPEAEIERQLIGFAAVLPHLESDLPGLHDETQTLQELVSTTFGPQTPLPELKPSAETSPMPQAGDAADDPAVWLHPENPAHSLILGTNKRQGLFVYDLQGQERQRLDVGRLNNVDVRYGVPWQGRIVDIAVASNRDLNALAVFAIDRRNAHVELVDNLPTRLDNIYGLCLYQDSDGKVFTFVNDEDGRFVQYAIDTSDTRWSAREVRSFHVSSQPEGCVADDANSRLYLGEEDAGIWTLGARAQDSTTLEIFARVGEQLHDDVEGLALVNNAGSQYLLASSQGNDSYVLFDTTPPYRPLGAFRIGMRLEEDSVIDGTSETDGLEVSRANLGGLYSEGILVVQDGRNVLPQQPQNFKLLPWSAVQALFPALHPTKNTGQ